jgi:hypothetical protein
MDRVSTPRSGRFLRPGLLLLIGIGSFAGGCGTQAWQQYSQSPANPAVWVRSLFPPDGEYFYNDKSHEIERSLSRTQNVELTP